ncbi:MAG TPA: aminotransferase class III-fold pyridoxal phosphate-dependent enzyme, partial [Bacteroidia bacterium]|nr:aminotransferase class III-fold pyridoxal phosphate-dependent enzyme [Bacteroidia bacterium]
AGTLSGNPVAMSAGIAQLSECLKPNFYKKLESKTQKLLSGLSQFKTKNFKVFSVGSIFWIAFTDKDKIQTAEDIDADSMQYFRTMYHHLLEHGIYMGPSGYEVGFMSEAHSDDDITKTIAAFHKALQHVQ